MNNKIERVACYIRVSTQEQKLHGLSLDAQRMKLTDYAEKHGMKIIDWYMDEGVSGRKLIKKRPELQRMIIDAEAGKFDRIIFIKLDRFFRSVAEYHECMKRIDPVVWSTTEEDYDLTTANGRLLVNMKLTIAELEADQTSERIKIVNEYKVTSGQPLWGTHSLPMGLKVATEDGRKKVVVDPETAPIVVELFNHYLMHQSKRKTVMYLKEHFGIKISNQTLTKLFSNKLLIGQYRDNPKYCEPILDKDVFDKVQTLLSRNLKRPPSRTIYKYSGLLVCPECGMKLVSGYNMHTQKNGVVYRYNLYLCPANRTHKDCSFNKRVYENTIEKMLLEKVESFFEDVKVKSFEVAKASSKPAVKANIEDILEEIDRLNYSWRTGKIKKVEMYEQDYAELMERLEAAQKQDTEIKEVDYSHIEKLLSSDWKDMYNALDEEHKRAFWRSFIDTIEIDWMTKGKKNKSIKRIIFF